MEYKFQKNQNNEACANVIYLFATLSRVLSGLLREMNAVVAAPYQHGSNIRKYRSRFCKQTREFNDLSLDELVTRLNSHPSFPAFCDKFPCVKSGFYKIDAAFVGSFEENSSQILEFCRTGMLFGIGFPSYEFTKFVAEVCNAQFEHTKFEEVYSKLEHRRLFFSFGL